MNNFILMQKPFKKSKTGQYLYHSIGLKELYPNSGYSSCDEIGNTNFIDPYKSETGKFAFIDIKSKEAFKGKIIYDEEEDIHFAIITLRK